MPTRGHRIGRFQRAWAALGALTLLLAACAERQPGQLAPVEGFAGLVAGDEPRAVVVGREILGNGGTAVDAAVAMYFTMAVTMPSRASLGGGGVCVVFKGDDGSGEAIEFLPRAAPSGGMVPSGMRAMAALHARHGALRWERLLAPAETLARFGHAASRAFATDLAAATERIAANPELRRLFSAPSGRLARTGDRIVQSELSAVLSGIRQQGAPYLHSGPFARRLAEASSAVGMPLSADDVRRNVPRIAPAVEIPIGQNYVAFFAPPRATGGVVAAQIWQMLREAKSYRDAPGEERDHLFAEAALRAFVQRAGWMEPDGASREPLAALVEDERLERAMANYDPQRHTPARSFDPAPPEISGQAYAAGFAIGDQWSNAVACSFTMNRLFGAARIARGTGILLAAPPLAQNDGSTSLAAAIVGSARTGDVRFVGTAGDGPAGATVLARTMLETIERERPLADAVGDARVHHGGAPDILWHEPGLGPADLDSLRRRGHDTRPIPAIGHVNALYCPDGLLYWGEKCQALSDPRGYGLAITAK